jgi:CheY-like chemotaxis protein
LNIVQDYRNQLEKDKDKRNLKLSLLYDHEFNKNNSYNDDDKSPNFIEADRERISQVLSNLLSNAIKFSKKMAEDYISIATLPDKKDDQVIVSVKDTGTGIDPQILPRIFEKFVTKSDAGTGLGLFIYKSIVEAHGGRIWAENNEDGGATFYFSLPLKKTIAQGNNNNNRIFIVDDEPDLTLAFKVGLEDNGFKVDAFNDPHIALSAFKNRPSYDLALIDTKMPKMNGFELYNEMKKIDDHVKVCFIIAFDIKQGDMDTVSSSDKKSVNIIRKPIEIEEMVQEINKQIA